MSDFKEKLLEVIAAKVIDEGHMSDLKMPEGFGVLRWTGWKEIWESLYPHAQIVWFMDRKPPEDRVGFYVDLPTMRHGKFKVGDPLCILSDENSHRMSEFTTREEIIEWFKEGLTLLLDDVVQECPWLVEPPAKTRGAA